MARFNAAKASNDMKTCYGLIYRKKEKLIACDPPDPLICEPWREEVTLTFLLLYRNFQFDLKFASNAGQEMKKCSHRVKEIKTRFTDLSNVFSNLKVRMFLYIYKHLYFLGSHRSLQKRKKSCVYSTGTVNRYIRKG